MFDDGPRGDWRRPRIADLQIQDHGLVLPSLLSVRMRLATLSKLSRNGRRQKGSVLAHRMMMIVCTLRCFEMCIC